MAKTLIEKNLILQINVWKPLSKSSFIFSWIIRASFRAFPKYGLQKCDSELYLNITLLSFRLSFLSLEFRVKEDGCIVKDDVWNDYSGTDSFQVGFYSFFSRRSNDYYMTWPIWDIQREFGFQGNLSIISKGCGSSDDNHGRIPHDL